VTGGGRPLFFLPPASDDAARAAAWYQRQAPGLGRAFLAELDQQARRIGHFPDSYPQVTGATPACRRANLPRFPYTVVYRALPSRVEVVAVLHCHADPAALSARADAPPE
jgi:plasmid stabilization system protein ParE